MNQCRQLEKHEKYIFLKAKKHILLLNLSNERGNCIRLLECDDFVISWIKNIDLIANILRIKYRFEFNLGFSFKKPYVFVHIPFSINGSKVGKCDIFQRSEQESRTLQTRTIKVNSRLIN